MKIVFVSDAVYPYHKGGKEKRIYELSTRLAKMGHEVHIFTMNWWKGEQVKKHGQIIYRGVCPYTPLYIKSRRSIWQGIYFSLRIFFPLLKEKFDVIEVDHMPVFPVYIGWLVCRLKRKKFYVTWHEVWGKRYWQQYLGSLKGFIAYLLEKYSTKLPDVFIAVSNLTENRLIDLFNVKPEKIKIVSNGVDVKSILQADPTKETSDLIFIGRCLSHKNIDVFIKVIDELHKKYKPEIKAIIIGDGPEKNSLENLVEKLTLQNNIIFKGVVSNYNEIYGLFKSSKVFLSASTREGFGIAVLEANACGLPVVVINHNENAATALVKNNYNGFICNLDEKEIANKIIDIFNSNDIEKYRDQAIKYSMNYDWDINVKKLSNIYNGTP